ncbi:MAG: ATP synthase F1 subunit epsilon [Candidatus Levybacteria bacterium RIFCSPHIGHO2_12_FULL_38_12]|nr:MAG: ATP synthase F1 subunit epsilon [Candidatus Levybacteria bacterium RIFCSPHIGHO2_01_FULL_38_12]OGH22432.1 MAG: ATP synthase F1 subunit epsilon [Candidatus Levybacteria bacterium RIFCSPHIGHO2_02_FULL_37_18]OGH23397.1 MAG: ATP synthase F1 subunit epsilon [Candidatus Levybacteria bacterium RIFCSPHIGHO2_12_FULL_38_12]OGH34906.1 MAG: ATP synthase F1 subunit epsilon [Candidatus Levybacteria bacterium RIFCSPLOWO2_01_FULL_37_20]OGH43648.1 MAG: ATP synthase F1 subunit epsilon [Candidatus Levybact
MTIKLQVITPEKIIYDDNVDKIIVPTPNGQIAILPRHITLLSQVSDGEIIVKKATTDHHIAVTGGFLEVRKNQATILADYAIESDAIQVAKAQEAKERAEKLLSEKLSEEDFAEIQSQLRRSLLELKVAEMKKRRKTI